MTRVCICSFKFQDSYHGGQQENAEKRKAKRVKKANKPTVNVIVSVEKSKSEVDTDKLFSERVKKSIYNNADGKCQNPECGLELDIKGDCAEFAHIYAREDNGPRYDPKKKARFISSAKNGLLLCCNCHDRQAPREIHRRDVGKMGQL
jgi:hypothetical protein